HRRVGDDDDPDRLPERRRRARRLVTGVVVRGLADELERDPDEEQPAAELQQRDGEQVGRDRDEEESKPDGAGGSPEAPERLLTPGQRADREGDHERVVTGQRQVDDDDADQPRPELRIQHRGHGLTPSTYRTSVSSSLPTTTSITAMARLR